MIKCINSNIEIYSDGNYNYNNWNLINNNGIFNILNNTSNRIDFCILQSGNIGIGSTSPVSKLDVVGNVSILGRTTLTSNLIVANTISTAPIAQFGTNTLAQSNVYIVGGSRGRLGIGSSSPTVPLDVVGSANISGRITANGGLVVPAGQTLNVIGELATASMNVNTINTAVINASESINANGGILLPFGSAIIANGGIYSTSINATDTIYANAGIIVSAGSLLSANGGISATTINASGLINANNGITIPTGKLLTANGGIETSGAIQVKSTNATSPIVQFGSNVSAINNLYFIGGGRARIGIGSSSPTVSLDVVGNANISDTITATTIGVSGAITANSIVSTTTIQAGDTIQAGGLITANGGITVPDGKQVVASGGITATGIQATTINTAGVINTNGGIISGSTITAYGLITANSGLSASTITSLGIINAPAGISATTIDTTAAIKGTTVEMSGFIKTTGGIETTTIVASGRMTANNGLTASSIHSTGVIIADTATSNTPIAQFGTNANASSNLYFIGGGNARIGIGSSSPTVSLDVIGDASITRALSVGDSISTTTITASQLITSTTLDVLNTLTIKSATATTPNAQIGINTDASSNLYFIGGGMSRIGIGSSSPNNALDIQGSMNITGFYKKNERDVILDTSNYILATSNIIVNRFADYIPYTWAINSQTLNLNYTLGNVGIGTINPAKKLHIMHPSGELIRIETNAEGANQVSGIEFGIPSYNTATRSKITSTTDGSGSSGSDLQFSTASALNTSSPKLIISPIGNVGIGSHPPLNILQVGNAGRLRIANTISDYTILGTADIDDTTNTKIELSGNTRSSGSGTISYVATNTEGSHRFMTNSTNERMCITSSGNVGIGTTTPEQLLTLYGSNARLKIKNSIDAASAATAVAVAINLDNGEQGEWIISNSNHSLAFDYKASAQSTASTTSLSSNRLIIDGVSGNIGIGANPSSNYKLNILGNLQIGGDIIPSGSNTYNLGSLTSKWKDLYLSGNSIYLDDLILSRDSNINLNIKDLRGNYRDVNVSNIQFHTTSNTLTIGIDTDGNIVYHNPSSNKTYYPVTTPYINNTTILDNVNDIILSTSNYAIASSNTLTNRITDLDNRQSNYVFATNDNLSTRITNLTTDMINENVEGAKKFIINHAYNNNLLINGTLTINSNLIVYGESTTLETTVYTTERLEIVNENNATTALMIQQKDMLRDIFIASNLDTKVFTIENNGDVNILGNYKKNNRDVLFDTSNYVLSTSNILVDYANMNDANNSNYISSTSNVLYNNIAFLDCKFKLLTFKVNLNDANTSNFIQTTSNILTERLYILDQLTSNVINNSITTLNIKANANDTNASNYILTTSNNLINYVLTSSNTLIDKANFNDTNASNYILTTSNNLINYVLTSSNTLIDKANFNDTNMSNYVMTTSNNLINYVLTSSNTLIDKANFNDTNMSNYVLATSNNLINYVLTSSNTLIDKANANDANMSNYVMATSNIISERLYILDQLTSNVINNSITTLNNEVMANDANMSNYVLTTSNVISTRITNLTTDMITENIDASNKFIVNNLYNNNLQINGTLTINSNLIVLGDTTQLDAVVYTTERLEIVNANNATTALMIQQNTANSDIDIFVASNVNRAVFKIANNGDVLINGEGNYKKNNRDVILDTSNYVLETSNILTNRLYILDQLTSNVINNSISTLNGKVLANNENSSNYVLATSNILAQRINKYSVWIPETSNIYYYSTGNVGIGTTLPATKLHLCDAISSNTTLTIQNNLVSSVQELTIPTEIVVAGATSATVGSSNITERYIMFPYTSDTTGFTGQTQYTFATTQNLLCDILVIGGGGGGASGGGGSGGYLYTSNVNMATGNYTVRVGKGGSGIATGGSPGSQGFQSVLSGSTIGTMTAFGGGGGGGSSQVAPAHTTGQVGSYGGTGADNTTRQTYTSTQGNRGGSSLVNHYGSGGGGGGANEVGGDPVYVPGVLAGGSTSFQDQYNRGGKGGDGKLNSITGTAIYYAGGGTGGANTNNQTDTSPQVAPLGGGGLGSRSQNENGGNGTNGLGGGGGGGDYERTIGGGNGGSGIVIIRYRTAASTASASAASIASASAASIEFIRGTQGDSNTDYKVGNYNGDFRILSSSSNIDTTRLLLTSNGNLTLGGSFDATSYLLNGSPFSIATEVGYTSNYISSVNESLINQISELNTSQLNYVLSTSSNIGDGLTTVIYNMNLNDRNISNYVLTTSNLIQRRINETTTDKIVEGSKNRFIIENKYNSNLEIKGSLVVNSNFVVNSLASLRNNVTITGDVNFTGELYKNGMLYPNGKTYTGSSSILSQYSPIQTQFTMYKNVVEKSGSGWQFIDNNTAVIDDKVQGFGVRIKPNHYSSKVLINLNCHIGIDYGTDARWWGIRLYRRIGEAGAWVHLTGADGTGSGNATTCWLSHNLGAESSTSSYFIANVSGAYYDFPETSEEYIYYTVKWCSLLGDDTQNGKLYLNRPAVINALNAPIVSSSWNVSEIWQLETSYFPKGGIVTKYTPTQTQFNIYKNLVEKVSAGWQFIDNDTSVINNTIQGFCVRIMPNHYTSKVLLNLNCHIGIDYGTDARWWGLRLYRRIGEVGDWVHLTDADGTDNNNNNGTPCWLSHNLGAESSTYSYFIANVSGAYYDFPNTMDTYVYYTVKWCSHLGDAAQNGKLYLNRPATYHTYDTGNTAILSSSWNAQEIWQRETTFIPKNAVICQNMSIQTLFNIYRNIVVKTGYGWQFIDNNITIINEKIQGFCVRIKPTHPSSKVLVHLSCHIGIDYGTDARWWGLRLYRKIGEAGAWEHITEADGNLIDNKGTSCWLSHNLGAESSTSSYFVANISGSFFDVPNTSSDFVYYTAKWSSILGDNSLEGKIYLNRPATYNEMNTGNSAVLSSSWNAQEIWQLGTPYEPTEYSIINIFNNNNVGIGTTNPVCKLDVDGTINATNYSTISDRRYKKDILAVDSSLGIINRLRPVSYLTIAQDEGDRRNYGFIAQDLHEVIPEAVNVPAQENHNYTIEYMSLIPLLTKSIQELSEKINEQQKTIEDLTMRLL